LYLSQDRPLVNCHFTSSITYYKVVVCSIIKIAMSLENSMFLAIQNVKQLNRYWLIYAPAFFDELCSRLNLFEFLSAGNV